MKGLTDFERDCMCFLEHTHTHKVSMLKSSLVGSLTMCPWVDSAKMCLMCRQKGAAIATLAESS